MKKPFRLLIAVPCMDYIHAEFVKSLMKLTGHLQRESIRFAVEIVAGTLVYFARNKLACKAINEGFTHILFLDSDMVFDEEIVETLTFCGKDFVCGAFQSRRPPRPRRREGQTVQGRHGLETEGGESGGERRD